jgi:hypothetical protein
MYYAEFFNNTIQTAKQQFRNDFQMAKFDGTVQVYARGLEDTKTFEIVSGGLQQVSSGGTFRGEGTFKLTKRIPQPDPTPDILEDFVTGNATTKTLTVLSGAALEVDGTTTLNGATTIASLNDARQGTFTYSFVYGNGSRNFSQNIQGVTVESFELALTFGHTFTANPYVHCVPVSTDYLTAGIRGVYVKSRNTTSVTFVIMLEAPIPQPTTFHWLAFRP